MPAPLPTKLDPKGNTHPDDPKAKDFTLNAEDTKFTNRNSSVFGSLQSLEEKHVQHVRHSDFNEERAMWKEDPETDIKSVGNDCNSGRPPFLAGRSSSSGTQGHGFKRPHPGSHGRSHMPSFRAEPSKWRRYDLSSVSDMSDKSNQKAAFDFLNDLKDRKGLESMETEETSVPHQVVFKKPEKKTASAAAGSSGPAASGSQGKIIMPEYVVGEKPKKLKQKPCCARVSSVDSTASTADAVQLGHLNNEETDSKKISNELCESGGNVSFKSSSKGKGRQHMRKRIVDEEEEDA